MVLRKHACAFVFLRYCPTRAEPIAELCARPRAHSRSYLLFSEETAILVWNNLPNCLKNVGFVDPFKQNLKKVSYYYYYDDDDDDDDNNKLFQAEVIAQRDIKLLHIVN